LSTTTQSPNQSEAPELPDGPRGLLIDGQFVDASDGQTIEVRNPATGAVQAEVAIAAAEDVDRAVASARKAFEGAWGEVTPSERGKILWRAADLIERNAEELALIESLDNGKPLAEANGDMWFAAETFRYYAGAATKIDGRTVTPSNPGKWHAYTRREPLGVVGQIIPWNFPLMMASWKVAPALATGNSVVLKPA
jgi:acyl-CoA reductase-like NAD-dependent aldehyde dehydrogenase